MAFLTMEVLARAPFRWRRQPVQDLVPLQDAVQTVAGDVAALQALAHKALQTRHFRRERTAGSHPGGRGFESR